MTFGLTIFGCACMNELQLLIIDVEVLRSSRRERSPFVTSLLPG
jgi:hypothetical protein